MDSSYLVLPVSKSGPDLPEVSVVSSYFVAYLTSFVVVAPFFRAKDPRVASRTDKFYAKALETLARVKNKDPPASRGHGLVVVSWYRRIPPVHCPERMDDKKVMDHEGAEAEDACNASVFDAEGSSPVLSEDEDEADGGQGARNEA